MKIASKTADRKQLVKALEEATGLKSRYLFSPSFAYEIGPYTVERSGDLVVEDADASKEVLAALLAKELIELPEETEEEASTIISLPLDQHSGRSLKNLIFLLHSKSVLLGRAVGRPGAYHVDEKLITALDEKIPEKTEDVLQILSEIGEEHLRGISFEGGKIGISYPYTTDPDRVQTYMQLSELMVKMAQDQVRVQPDKSKTTNEKYTFRVWLMRLGMKGDEYKTARKILLENLKGNGAFRTKDQMDAAREKLKAQRAAEKEAASETAFEAL